MGFVGAGSAADYVAGAGRGGGHGQWGAGGLTEGLGEFEDGGALAGAEVYDVVAGGDVVETLQAGDVGAGEVPNVDVVAQAGAVAGRPVNAGDGEGLAGVVGGDHLAQRMGRGRVLQACAQGRVGSSAGRWR